MSEHLRVLLLAMMGLGGLLGGCAPAAHMRPLVPLLPNHDGELGMAYTAVGPRPVGQDPWRSGAQAWGTLQPTASFDMSLVGVFADTFSAGLALRWRALETSAFAAGLGAELGVGWLAVNLPFAVRVQDQVWIYSAPQYGAWGVDETIRLPLGVDVEVSEELHVRGEAQLNYPDFDPYKRRVHMGLGLAFQL